VEIKEERRIGKLRNWNFNPPRRRELLKVWR